MKKYWIGLAGVYLSICCARAGLLDDFDREDVSYTGNGSALGAGWINSDPVNRWSISGGRLLGDRVSSKNMAVLYNTRSATVSGGENPFIFSADVVIDTQNNYAGIAFNYQDPANYYALRIKSGAGTYAVVRYIENTPKIIAGGTAAASFKPGTAYTLTVKSGTGGTFEMTITEKGKSTVLNMVTTFSDITHSGGYCGLYISSPKSVPDASFDDVQLTPLPSEGKKKLTAVTNEITAGTLSETKEGGLCFALTNKNRELLYNGIVLPAVWPPEAINPKSTAPMPVPYLDDIPELIPIDVGRQLFFDDFLIAETDLQRTFHYPQKYEGNPVLKAETPLELDEIFPGACPKSGGLWWDPDEQIFKLWYEARWLGTICYATSTNGIDWDRPNLDVVPGSNQVLPPDFGPDSWTVVRDWDAENPNEKYKIFVRERGGPKYKGARCFLSPDGIHWNLIGTTGLAGDRSTMFYNPFRKKWVYSIRSVYRGRSRHYWEEDEFGKNNKWDTDENTYGSRTSWKPGHPVIWTGADELDPPDEIFQKTAALYNLDAVAYESIMLGFYQIWRGPDNTHCLGFPKITELNFAYSRDGFHWDRPDRTTAIEASREAGTWDRGYVQSLGNICVLRGDKIWFYYTGYAGDERFPEPRVGMYANGAMGVAFLRRDGFASMKAGQQPGVLTTRPVSFSGKYLFVNADVSAGVLQAEVLDKDGAPILPFTKENSTAYSGDSTIKMMTWSGGSDLSVLGDRAVQFRFHLENGNLYSFWVSLDESGRSDGYVAGGGPGYTGATDTVGSAALEANKKWEGN